MKVPNTNENYEKCICYRGECPTYNENKLSGGLFCSRGKSETAVRKVRCICDECPVWAECNLNDYHYCTKGATEG